MLFREYRFLSGMEKTKQGGMFFSKSIKNITKYFINKHLRPFMKNKGLDSTKEYLATSDRQLSSDITPSRTGFREPDSSRQSDQITDV